MLDDLKMIEQIDTENMLGILDKFPEQIEEIVKKMKKLDLFDLSDFHPTDIMVLGMGGSGISGDILNSWLDQRDGIIIRTNRNYSLPVHVDQNTLVFACSYSGNTEETLSAVYEAQKRECKIISITSGGELKDFSKKNNIRLIEIPKGIAPRAAVAFLLFPMIIALEKMKVIKPFNQLENVISELKKIRRSIQSTVPIEKNHAKQIAVSLSKGIPYIYGHTYLNTIARRWKTQLNENSKVLAMDGEIPEMNHNEIVGWSGDNQEIAKRFVIVLLRSADEQPRIRKRLELSKKMLKAIVFDVLEVEAFGKTVISKMLNTMYVGDYVSVYLAILRELDPTPVVSIERFKKLMED